MLDVADRSALCWPDPHSRDDSVAGFADALFGYAQEIRRFRTPAKVGFVGGRSPHHSYQAKSFTRLVLLHYEDMRPCSFDKYTVERILDWTPDENRHVDHVRKLRGRDAREKFAMSPLLLGCWCCIVATMATDDITNALGNCWSVAAVMRCYRMYERDLVDQDADTDDPVFAPGPRIIAEALHENSLCDGLTSVVL